MAEKRRPWMKFFTRDWRANAKLRLCSYAARGLWADMMTLMWESPRIGFLMVDDLVPTTKQLAALLGGSEKEVGKLLGELRDANVYSVEDGVIYSRRMVRDKAKEDKDRENGKGGGNPKLLLEDKRQDKEGVNPPSNPQRSEIRDQKNNTQGAKPIPDGWKPTDIDLAGLRKGRPDLVGEFYETRMQDFRDWCRENAVTTHDPTSTWGKFMRKSFKQKTLPAQGDPLAGVDY